MELFLPVSYGINLLWDFINFAFLVNLKSSAVVAILTAIDYVKSNGNKEGFSSFEYSNLSAPVVDSWVIILTGVDEIQTGRDISLIR